MGLKNSLKSGNAEEEPISRVLVVQPWGMGDLVNLLPAIRLLKRELAQDCCVDVVVSGPGAAHIAQRSLMFKRVFVLGANRILRYVRLTQIALWTRALNYDCVMLATEISTHYARLFRFLYGNHRVWSDHVSLDGNGKRFLANRAVSSKEHRAVSNVELVKMLLQKPVIGEGVLTFPTIPLEDHEAEFAGDNFIVIHPGCYVDREFSRLPGAKFGEFIDLFLHKVPDTNIKILFGPSETGLEADYSSLQSDRVSLVNSLSLDEVLILVSHARCVLTSDSGIGHLAAAVGTPVVTIAGPTNIERSGPFGEQNSIVRTQKPLACMPCYYSPLYGNCPYDIKCLTSVDMRDALSCVKNKLHLLNLDGNKTTSCRNI